MKWNLNLVLEKVLEINFDIIVRTLDDTDIYLLLHMSCMYYLLNVTIGLRCNLLDRVHEDWLPTTKSPMTILGILIIILYASKLYDYIMIDKQITHHFLQQIVLHNLEMLSYNNIIIIYGQFSPLLILWWHKNTLRLNRNTLLLSTSYFHYFILHHLSMGNYNFVSYICTVPTIQGPIPHGVQNCHIFG